jgi:hypothetical protein
MFRTMLVHLQVLNCYYTSYRRMVLIKIYIHNRQSQNTLKTAIKYK